MRVTANQVTLTRLVLLPVPVVMIYRQTTGWMLAGLVIFVVLGLTDAVDGMLARRFGTARILRSKGRSSGCAATRIATRR